MEMWQYVTLTSGAVMLLLYFKRRSARLGSEE